MSYLHTYEYDCSCGNRIKMEVHTELDKHIACPCGKEMDMVFYLRSPDERAKI